MGRMKETMDSPSYARERESFVARLRLIAALATEFADELERDPALGIDDYQVYQLATEIAALAYSQGVASALKGSNQ